MNRLALVQELLAKCGGSPYNSVNGLQVPFFVQQETVDKLKSLPLHPDDVWVVSYPKSGTTWMQQIVRLIRNNGVLEDTEAIDIAVPWLEGLSIYPEVNVDSLSRPRLFKSHMPYDFCPCGPPNTTPCKYIYIMRNPKDVAVSYYFFNKKLPYHNKDLETFWKMYIKELDFGNHFDHVLSWWSHRDDENVLILTFEDMKKDLPAAVSQVALFIGADISSDVIAKISALAEFDHMKNDITARKSLPDFYRKGTVGDWKNYLTPEQSAEIDTICAQRLKGTGLEFQFE